MDLARWNARHEGDPRVVRRGPSAQPVAARLAKGLGWFSIGLGLVELLAPRRLTHALGMGNRHAGLVRGFGAREIASGVAVLSVDPRAGLWSRVGGDAVDLAALGMAARALPRLRSRRARRNIGIAMAAVAGVLVVDALVATALQRQRARRGPVRDYGDRSGFARPAEDMRGAARDFKVPEQMRAALPRPGAQAQAHGAAGAQTQAAQAAQEPQAPSLPH